MSGWLLMCAACLCLHAASPSNTEEVPTIMATVDPAFQGVAVASIEHFGKRVYQTLSPKGGNFVMSPLSAVLFVLLWRGSGGHTEYELGTLLHLPEHPSVDVAFYALLDELQALQGSSLHVSQHVYVQEGLEVSEEYLRLAELYFMASVRYVDFAANMDAARRSINNWFFETTGRKIKDIIRPGMVDSHTKLLLVSAMYLKSRWAVPFSANETTKERFHLGLTSSARVDMMHCTQVLHYVTVHEIGADVLRVPLEMDGVSLLIVLPFGYGGIRRVESKLAYVNVTAIMLQMAPYNVRLSMPRFQINSTIRLKDVLHDMGISDIFQQSANFSTMAKHPLYASQALQRVIFDVNESGIEGISFRVLQIPGDKYEAIEFLVNRPFIFMVHEAITGVVLFMGRYVHP